MSLQSAPAVGGAGNFTSPSYFAALYDGANPTASNFANTRLTAQSSGAGFVFAARVTGQAGYPFKVGTTPLSYNTLYNVIVEADMIAGTQNDVVKVYVNPTNTDPNLETPYLVTAPYVSGAATDPATFGSFVLSQFASGTVGNVGVTFNSVVVSDTFAEAAMISAVPEARAFALGGVVCAIGRIGVRRSVANAPQDDIVRSRIHELGWPATARAFLFAASLL